MKNLTAPLAMARPMIQRKCACGEHTTGGECDACGRKKASADGGYALLQRKAAASAPNSVPPIVYDVLRSPGQPLDGAARAFFEPRFSYDFSGVRVHTNNQAAASARSVSAAAYTVGNQIVFDDGKYSSTDSKGQGLLAHELTHVIQQGGTRWQPGGQLSLNASERSLEASAERNADGVSAGQSLKSLNTAQQGTVQRDEAEVDKQKGVTPRFQFDPSIIDLGLDITKGRHKFSISGSLSEPINLFGVNLPGLDPSQFLASLGYNNECNQAVQSVLLQFGQDQKQGGHVFDFNRNELRIGAKLKFRLGNFAVEPGGDVAFHGNQVDSVFAMLTLTAGVDPTIPTKCIPKPEPPKRTPDKPKEDQPDKPKDFDKKVPDKPGGPPRGGGDIVKPPSDPVILYFFYDTSVIKPESNHSFDYLLASLQAFPSLNVVLLGHTSLEGSDAYNMKLSQSRAEAVRSSLTMSGIDASRIRTIPMGESAPAVIEPPEPKHTFGDKLEKLRDMNRRVQVVFFDPTGKFGPTTPELKLTVPERIKPGSNP